MSHLFSAAITADTPARAYQVPAGSIATLVTNVVNTGKVAARVSMFLVKKTDTVLDAPAKAIEYNVELKPGQVLLREGIFLDADQGIAIASSSADIAVNGWGIEEIKA